MITAQQIQDLTALRPDYDNTIANDALRMWIRTIDSQMVMTAFVGTNNSVTVEMPFQAGIPSQLIAHFEADNFTVVWTPKEKPAYVTDPTAEFGALSLAW